MKKTIFPQDQTFWYLRRPDVQPLRTNQEADVVVIGGGMAGLTTAHAFARKGKKVILLEAFYCGAGASGKSSGFITQNGEVSLSEFVKRHGNQGGSTIWHAIENLGLEYIRNTIREHSIACDYIEEDTIEVACLEKDLAGLLEEAENLTRFGFASHFTKKEDMPSAVGSHRYYGGVTYANSFGINGYKYCTAMKNILKNEGVEVYEETPVLRFKEHKVTTLHATVKADTIVVCADRFIPSLGKLKKVIGHVQTFLLLSQALTYEELRAIFPQKTLMVFDTDPVYNYYRLTGNRLLLGGGSPRYAFAKKASHDNNFMYKKLARYAAETFPQLTLQFEHMWPGLIGITKDIAPVAGRDKDEPSIYYIGAAAGLTLAAMLGNYCATHIIDGDDTLKDYFSPYREF